MTSPIILFVEDEPDYQMIVSRTLEEAGYSTRVAGSAEEAWDILVSEKPRLLLLDINLPGMNGYELCQRLREDESGARLPILMLTVRRRPNEWLDGFSSGADDYLAKPFNPPDLIERVRYCLRQKPDIRLSPDVPENLLIESAIAGNRPAFEVLMTKYKDPLLNTLMRRGATRAEADEIVDATFAEAFEGLREYHGNSTFFTWLCSVALHELRHLWRRPTSVTLESLSEEEESELLEAVEDPEPDSKSDEKHAPDLGRLYRALLLVPFPYRKMLELFYFQKQSYERIARELDLPAGTVMSRLFRGKRHLRRAWDRCDPTPIV